MGNVERRLLRKEAVTRHVKPLLLWWAGCFLLWFALVATTDGVELAAGAAAALIAAVAAEVVRSQRLAEHRVPPDALHRLWRLPWLVLVDTVTVTRALWRDLRGASAMRGAFRAVPYRVEGEDPVAAGRRAVVTARVSLTPNTYVVGFDEDEGLMLVHQLVPSPRASTARDVDRAL